MVRVASIVLLLSATPCGAALPNCDFEWGTLQNWSAIPVGTPGNGGSAQVLSRYGGGSCVSGGLNTAPYTSGLLPSVWNNCYSVQVYSGDGCVNGNPGSEYILSRSFTVPPCTSLCFWGAAVLSGNSSKWSGGGCVSFDVSVGAGSVCYWLYQIGDPAVISACPGVCPSSGWGGNNPPPCGQLCNVHHVCWKYLPWTQMCCDLSSFAGQTATFRVHAYCGTVSPLSGSEFTPAYALVDDVCLSAPCTPTPLLSSTVTATRTISPTATESGSQTATCTATHTPTESGTRTPSGSPTETFTISPTFTESLTPTNTATPTQSATFSQSPTLTRTVTQTETPTITQTPTITPTPTVSATGTVTATKTPTTLVGAPYVGISGPLNPSGLRPIHIEVVVPRSSALHLAIFNSAGELVRGLSNNEVQERTLIAFDWDGNNDLGNPVTSNIYVLRLSSTGFTAFRRIPVVR